MARFEIKKEECGMQTTRDSRKPTETHGAGFGQLTSVVPCVASLIRHKYLKSTLFLFLLDLLFLAITDSDCKLLINNNLRDHISKNSPQYSRKMRQN